MLKRMGKIRTDKERTLGRAKSQNHSKLRISVQSSGAMNTGLFQVCSISLQSLSDSSVSISTSSTQLTSPAIAPLSLQAKL